MRETRVLCDRCGAICRSFSVIEAAAGPLRARTASPIDLCEDCAARLVGWLRSGHPADERGLGGAMQGTAVASGQLS
jgi:hypothetical protein